MREGAPRGSFDSLEEFIATAKRVVATGQELDEANTKAKLITPLIRTLGWRVYDNNEVLLEYSGDGFAKQADYVLFGPDGPHAVVEAKSIGRDLDQHEQQIREYVRLFDTEWGLLTNGQHFRVFQEKENQNSGPTKVETTRLPNLGASTHLQALTRRRAYSEDSGPIDTNTLSGISDETKRKIVEISAESNVYELLVESVAHSVYGYEQQKLAIALSLFGGVTKKLPDGQVIRGTPHVLFVSDPGMFTEQLAE